MTYSIAELRRDFLVGARAAGVRRIGEGFFDGFDGPAPASIAIGVFDGLHVGHSELLARTVEDARRRGTISVAVTFDPDPDQVVSRSPSLKLMSVEDRLRALSLSGVDAVLVVPFDRSVAALDHVGFFEGVLAPYLDIRSIHVGSDFRLGARGASNVDVIARWGSQRSIEVFGHDLVSDQGVAVTATRIRSLLSKGEIDDVSRELGRTYVVRGAVGSGRGQGTGMGFPTANVIVDPMIQLPLDGVYAGYAYLDGFVWPAAVNVGIPPMFAQSKRSARLEANLLGFSGDLYGKDLKVSFTKRLRPSCHFDSIAQLIEVVNGDIETVSRLHGDSAIRIAHD
ncbi:riboflavin biosynthesis protein RibF [Collinsella tanakaei]|uniref:riboflavin biosynthesis protein RibF n=1 Tax=Collinsella tanakaei TaxID=626935 RepID=UPI00265A9715|nr:riboflavin biosynthesis protein RibF [Collinsella tanakaei]